MEGLTNYTEYLVKKKPDAKTVLLRIAVIVIWCAAVAATLIGVLMSETMRMLIMVLPVLWLFLGLLCYLILDRTNIEYEYAIVSGYFQLDAIYGKKSRKRICEAKISEIRFCAPANEKNASMRDKSNFLNVIEGCSSRKSENLYCFAYNDKAGGETLVYFDATKKAIDCFVFYNRNATDRGSL